MPGALGSGSVLGLPCTWPSLGALESWGGAGWGAHPRWPRPCVLSPLSPAAPALPTQAGITTTLNSRCSVLAAANSVFGRWDETKGEDNIDFMPTILSRFDMIFIVKDEHNEERDVVRGDPAPARPTVPGGAAGSQQPGLTSWLPRRQDRGSGSTELGARVLLSGARCAV